MTIFTGGWGRTCLKEVSLLLASGEKGKTVASGRKGRKQSPYVRSVERGGGEMRYPLGGKEKGDARREGKKKSFGGRIKDG